MSACQLDKLGFISFPQTVLENPGWIGDLEYRVLEVLFGYRLFKPHYIYKALGISPQKTHVVLLRLMRRGIVERVSHGLYRVVVDLSKLLAKVKVRRLSVRKTEDIRVSSCVPVCSGCVGYLGLFFDDVRYYVGGVFFRQPRGGLWSCWHVPSVDEFSYGEVCHLVGGLEVHGAVVVYSNFREDGFDRVRVEFRPPSGFVRRNGLAGAVRFSIGNFVNAWRALCVVLREHLSNRLLGYLVNWLLGLWGLGI